MSTDTDTDTTCVLCGLQLDDDELQEGTGLGDQRRPCLPGRIHLLPAEHEPATGGE